MGRPYAIWVVAPLVLVAALAGSAAWRAAEAAGWRTASRESVGIAPDPATTPEALIQVYAARAWSWRGVFGVHSWIAVKPSGAPVYTVYEVIGWRARQGRPALSINGRPPDGRWFGAAPEVIAEVRGEGIDAVIERLDKVARSYPYMDQYRIWPGPNSNTFTAYVGRAVPELGLDLPPTAIGKDFLPGGHLVAASPSGTGVQISLFGMLGVLVGLEEGIEVNVLGMVFGIDPLDWAIKLPAIGRIGGG